MSIKSISLINGSDNKTATGNKPAITIPSNKPINTLIINHLPQTPTATTGKQPAKPEMENKPNMTHETTK